MEYSVKEIGSRFGLLDRMFLLGAPGVGKTTFVEEMAREEARKMGREFVDVFRIEEPEKLDLDKVYLYAYIHAPSLTADELAFVAKKGDRYDWTLPTVFEVMTKPNAVGLMFLDEVTNVQDPGVESLLFAIVLEKRIVVKRLSDRVKVIVAGNQPKYSGVASELSSPLVNRFSAIFNVRAPSVEEWIEWMEKKAEAGRKYDKRVALYLSVYKSDMLRVPAERTLEPYPTPRSWTRLAWMLADGLPLDIAPAVVGREAGLKFVKFASVQLDPEDVWRRPEIYLNTTDIEKVYLAVGILSERVKARGRDVVRVVKAVLGSNEELLMLMLQLIPKKERVRVIMEASKDPEVKSKLIRIGMALAKM